MFLNISDDLVEALKVKTGAETLEEIEDLVNAIVACDIFNDDVGS